MVKNTRTKYTEIVNQNTFMGIEVPEFEHFKITLTESIKIGKKDGEEFSRDFNFNLIIKSQISKAYKEKLDNELKSAFKLNWVPFNYHTQEYQYYTSKYVPESEKVERLNSIFEVLKNFEIYYKEAVKESLQLFNKDMVENKTYSDHEVVVKFNENKNCFVVIALKFLSAGKYPILANASLKKGKLSETNYKESGFFDEFVNWDKHKKEIYYFEINPESYLEIKNLIEIKEKTKELFNKKQNEILEKVGKENLAHFEEENIFDLKIIYDEKLNMFEFYCRGYFQPEKYGTIVTERRLIPFLAVNYLLSKELTKQEIEDNFKVMENGGFKSNDFITDIDLSDECKYKYNLKLEEETIKRDKKMYLSLEYNNVLKEVISNYEKHREFFGRKVKTIKIENNNSTDISGCLDKKYPSIYLNDDGRSFYVLGTRENSEILKGTVISETKLNKNGEKVAPRISKGRSASFTMKALEITHKEALYYLYESPWKKQIEENSIYLNTELWLTNNNKPQINHEDRIKSFNMLILSNKLKSETKNQELEKTKAKKKKI